MVVIKGERELLSNFEVFEVVTQHQNEEKSRSKQGVRILTSLKVVTKTVPGQAKPQNIIFAITFCLTTFYNSDPVWKERRKPLKQGNHNIF